MDERTFFNQHDAFLKLSQRYLHRQLVRDIVYPAEVFARWIVFAKAKVSRRAESRQRIQ